MELKIAHMKGLEMGSNECCQRYNPPYRLAYKYFHNGFLLCSKEVRK